MLSHIFKNLTLYSLLRIQELQEAQKHILKSHKYILSHIFKNLTLYSLLWFEGFRKSKNISQRTINLLFIPFKILSQENICKVYILQYMKSKEWKQVMETRMSECNKSETRYDERAYMPVYTEVDLKRVKRIGRGWSEW